VGVLIGLFLAAGVWVLIGQLASFHRLGDALRHADPAWLVLSVGATAAGYLGYALLFRSVATVAEGPQPPLPLVLRLTVAVFGASVIATSAGRLGSEYWAFRRMGEPAPQAWSRSLAINVWFWAVLGALAWSGATALLIAGGRAPLSLEVAWIIVLPACAAPAWLLSSAKRRHLAEDRGGWARRGLAAALRSLVLLRGLHGRRLRAATTGGLLHWGAELLTVWAALRAFGVDLSYGSLVLAYATGYVVTMVPLPAGGAGAVDAASTFALTLVGVPLAPALLATLVMRLATYWLPLGVAAVQFRSVRRLGDDLAAVPRRIQRLSQSARPAPAGTTSRSAA
jgi:uncharacterized membrane protein YbhN (UPF0104 family)